MIQFDEDTHTYRDAAGIVPGVTRVLQPLSDLSHIPAAVLERKSHIGRAVHRATELIDEGTLDDASVHESCVGYVAAYRRFLSETGFVPEHSEQLIYHPAMRYAGTLDRIGHFPGRPRALGDYKTVATMNPATGVQTAAYKAAWEAAHPDQPIADRFGLQLRPDGTYRLQTYADSSDWPTFVGLLTIHNWLLKNKKEMAQ